MMIRTVPSVFTCRRVFSSCFLSASFAAACFWAGVSSIFGLGGGTTEAGGPPCFDEPPVIRFTRLAGNEGGKLLGS